MYGPILYIEYYCDVQSGVPFKKNIVFAKKILIARR